MFKLLLLLISAFCGYFICALNPAIEISKRVYNKDIRECNSGNPGFTNFKRSFGIKWAVPVLLFDLLKAVIVLTPFTFIFDKFGIDASFGAAFIGLFCMLGHAFPVYYSFKGGKGFLVYMSVIFYVDPVAGLIAFLVLCILLLTLKYMSLATMAAVVSSVITLLIRMASICTVSLCAIQVIFMIYRHKDNIKRLINGTERKFTYSKS